MNRNHWPSSTYSPYLELRGHLYRHQPAHFGIIHSSIYDSTPSYLDENDPYESFKAFRSVILKLSESEILGIVTNTQNCIDACQLPPATAALRLRLLQDLCSISGVLPKPYWMTEVSKGRPIGSGAEATTYKGRRLGVTVVVREFRYFGHDRWAGNEGKSVPQVRPTSEWTVVWLSSNILNLVHF
ncbi:hypothetical protein DL93DRAFT_414575 [Clavulina sp. PMI_390]|nr:hypothetical protein DL93DRAFT_414575 [Clavulina sp. PMI_390]